MIISSPSMELACNRFQVVGIQQVRGEHAFHLQYGNIHPMPLLSHQFHPGLTEGVHHQFRAIHACGIAVIIVMVEERMAAIHLQRLLRRPDSRQGVLWPAHLPQLCINRGEECFRGVHLHTVGITFEVRFARNGMHHHLHPSGIHHCPRGNIRPFGQVR